MCYVCGRWLGNWDSNGPGEDQTWKVGWEQERCQDSIVQLWQLSPWHLSFPLWAKTVKMIISSLGWIKSILYNVTGCKGMKTICSVLDFMLHEEVMDEALILASTVLPVRTFHNLTRSTGVGLCFSVASQSCVILNATVSQRCCNSAPHLSAARHNKTDCCGVQLLLTKKKKAQFTSFLLHVSVFPHEIR